MKKLLLLIIIALVIGLSACGSKAIAAREILYDILQEYPTKQVDDFPADFENVYYSGFSSYTVADDSKFELTLLKNDIYSQLTIHFEEDVSAGISIQMISVFYYNFKNDLYYLISLNEDESIKYKDYSMDSFVVDFSKIRIEDIRWILKQLEYQLD